MINSKIIYSLSFCLLIYSCASQMIPTGGQRDINPPEITETFPNNKSLNYKENYIKLSFDEFVELENPNQNIVVSPYQQSGIKSKIVGKNIFVYFIDSLLSQKTYSISFINAIKDYTEGNFLKNYNFTFSTGATLDSNVLNVNLYNAYSNEKITNGKVVFTQDFNNFQRGNYIYIAKNQDSSFVFDNLDKNYYQIFSYIDSNKNNKWDKEEFVAFSSLPINYLNKKVEMSLFVSTPKKYNYKVTSLSNHSAIIDFMESVEDLTPISNNIIVESIGINSYLVIDKSQHSMTQVPVKVNKITNDTLLISPTKNKTIQFVKRSTQSTEEPIYLSDSVSISFDHVLYPTKASTVKIYEDTVLVNQNYQWIQNRLEIKNLKPGKSYKVVIDSGSMKTIDSLYCNKMVTLFKTFPKDMVRSNVMLSFDIPMLSNYMVQLFNSHYSKTFNISSQNKDINLFNVPIGTYQVRLIHDQNKNGLWDSGDLFNRTQPEKISIKKIEIAIDKESYKINL